MAANTLRLHGEDGDDEQTAKATTIIVTNSFKNPLAIGVESVHLPAHGIRKETEGCSGSWCGKRDVGAASDGLA